MAHSMLCLFNRWSTHLVAVVTAFLLLLNMHVTHLCNSSETHVLNICNTRHRPLAFIGLVLGDHLCVHQAMQIIAHRCRIPVMAMGRWARTTTRETSRTSSEEEELMITFLEKNEFLWNKKSMDYKKPDL